MGSCSNQDQLLNPAVGLAAQIMPDFLLWRKEFFIRGLIQVEGRLYWRSISAMSLAAIAP